MAKGVEGCAKETLMVKRRKEGAEKCRGRRMAYVRECRKRQADVSRGTHRERRRVDRETWQT